jgi:hypothetical protein
MMTKPETRTTVIAVLSMVLVPSIASAETVSLHAESMELEEGFEVETDRWFNGGRDPYIVNCSSHRPGVASALFAADGRFEMMIGVVKDRERAPWELEISVDGGRSRSIYVSGGGCPGSLEWISAGEFDLYYGGEIVIRSHTSRGLCAKIDSIRLERVDGQNVFDIDRIEFPSEGGGCSDSDVDVDSVYNKSGATLKADLRQFQLESFGGGKASRRRCEFSTWINHDCSDGLVLHNVSLDAFADVADSRGAFGMAKLVASLDGGSPIERIQRFPQGHLGERTKGTKNSRIDITQYPWQYSYEHQSELKLKASIKVKGPNSYIEIGSISSEIKGALGCR